MSPFLTCTTLLLVLGTECFGWKHDFFIAVSEYFNDNSPRRNLIPDTKHSKEPRGTLACALTSAEIFYENLNDLISDCVAAEEEFTDLTTHTEILTENVGKGVELLQPLVDASQWRKLLNIRDKGFADEYIRFLVRVWKMIDKYKNCALKGHPKETIHVLFNEFNRRIEQFTTDTIHHCGIPYRFYPGETRRNQNIPDEATSQAEAEQHSQDLQLEMENIYKISEDLYSATGIPFMLWYIDGYNKVQTVGCVRNAAFALFSALRSDIPGGCPSLNKKIERFMNAVFKDSPLYVTAMDISMIHDARFFEIGMENLMSQKASVLQGFESCFQRANLPPDSHIEGKIAWAFSNHDVDVVNCKVDLKYLKPHTPVDPLDIQSSFEDVARSRESGTSTPTLPPEKKFISFHPTPTAVFFEQNPPGTVSCFKSITRSLFTMIEELIDDTDGCPRGANAFTDFELYVETRTPDGAFIHRDRNADLFEKEMDTFNVLGRTALKIYGLCLRDRNIFQDDGKRGRFAGGVIRFQGLYEGCGAYSEKNFWEGPLENLGKPETKDTQESNIS